MKEAASDMEKDGIVTLMNDLKGRRKALRKAEHSRKRRWRRKNTRQGFYRDPYGTVKKILSPKCQLVPNVSREKLEDYISQVVSDANRDIPLGPLEGLEPAREPEVPFKECNLQKSQLEDVVKTRRNASKPGPNQIP